MEINFDEVAEVWNKSGGKNTGGILQWFAPFTANWTKTTIKLSKLGSLFCIGGYPTRSAEGTYKLAEVAAVTTYDPEFRWDPAWCVIAVRDPETSGRIVLDGNGRALQAWLALQNDSMAENQEIGIIIGDLDLRIVRISKALAPLYR